MVPIALAACTGIPGIPGSGDKQASDATSEPTPAPDYFPLIEGATWTYKGYRYTSPSSHGTPNGYMVFKVLGVEVSGDLATASMKTTSFDNDGKEQGVMNGLYVKEADGIYTVNADGSNKQILIPWPLRDGTEILAEATSSATSTDSAKVRATVSGKILVTDGGRFEGCYEVGTGKTSSYSYYDSYTKQTITRSSTDSNQVTVAPNVGMVRSDYLYESVSSVYPLPDHTRTIYEIATYSIPMKK
jgi:hypothetical protein